MRPPGARIAVAVVALAITISLPHCHTATNFAGSSWRPRLKASSTASLQLRGTLRGGRAEDQASRQNETLQNLSVGAIDSLMQASNFEEAMPQAIALSHQLWRARSVNESIPVAEKALLCARKVHGDTGHMDVAQALNNKGVMLASVNRHDEALQALEEALTITKSLMGDDSETVVRALHNLAMMYLSTSQFKEAEAKCAECVSVLEAQNNTALLKDMLRKVVAAFASRQQEHRVSAYAHRLSNLTSVQDFWDCYQLGCEHVGGGRVVEAVEAFQTALNTLHDLSPPPDNVHALTAKCLIASAGALFQAGHLDAAETCVREGRRRQAAAGEGQVEGEERLTAAHALGKVCSAQGDFEGAVEPSEAAVALHLELHGERHADRAMHLANLGTVLMHLGRHQQAVDTLHAARQAHLTTQGGEGGGEGVGNLTTLGAKIAKLLGSALLNGGDAQQAVPLLEEATRDGELLPARDLPVTTVSLGLAHFALQQHTQAVAAFAKALALLDKTQGEEELTFASLFRMGESLQAMGQTSAALTKFEAALTVHRQLDMDGRDLRLRATLHSGIAQLQWAVGGWEECVRHSEQEWQLLKVLRGDDHEQTHAAHARASAARVKMQAEAGQGDKTRKEEIP